MKFSKFSQVVLLLLTGLFIVNCSQGPKEEPAAPEATPVPPEPEITERYQVDEAMNPLNVYKDHTKVFADSLNVQMYELILKPGDSIGMHEHLDHTVYVLEGGTLLVWPDGKDAVVYNMETGMGFLGGPLKDVAKNTGDTTVRLLITEIFRPRME